MGRYPENPDIVGRGDARGGAGSDFAAGQDSTSWDHPVVLGQAGIVLIFHLLMMVSLPRVAGL
jgi:hypothetical protein